jgi:putative tricarboxylic transport membrane protein
VAIWKTEPQRRPATVGQLRTVDVASSKDRSSASAAIASPNYYGGNVADYRCQHRRNLSDRPGEVMTSNICLRSILIAMLLASHSLPSSAQVWKPERPVEIVVGCAPGCGPDNMARLMQRVLRQNCYFEFPVSIQNKANGVIGRQYLSQFEGNAHYLYPGDRGMLASALMGRGGVQYTDLTPIAILFGEYIGVAVRADSTIASGRALIERLRKDPAAYSFGIATALGNSAHQSVAGALKNAGVDIRNMRVVTFNSGALAITAMLGGHIDVVPASVSYRDRQLRVAPRRPASAIGAV